VPDVIKLGKPKETLKGNQGSVSSTWCLKKQFAVYLSEDKNLDEKCFRWCCLDGFLNQSSIESCILHLLVSLAFIRANRFNWLIEGNKKVSGMFVNYKFLDSDDEELHILHFDETYPIIGNGGHHFFKVRWVGQLKGFVLWSMIDKFRLLWHIAFVLMLPFSGKDCSRFPVLINKELFAMVR